MVALKAEDYTWRNFFIDAGEHADEACVWYGTSLLGVDTKFMFMFSAQRQPCFPRERSSILRIKFHSDRDPVAVEVPGFRSDMFHYV